jgi:hypothetical protein
MSHRDFDVRSGRLFSEPGKIETGGIECIFESKHDRIVTATASQGNWMELNVDKDWFIFFAPYNWIAT